MPANPDLWWAHLEDRFFHDNAHSYHDEAYLNCFYLIYVFVFVFFQINPCLE